jgi:hypothetical protein
VVEGSLPAFALIFKGTDMRRQQTVEREGVAFFLRKGGAFVKRGVEQQVISGEMSANHRCLGGGGGLGFGGHGVVLL